MTNDRSITISTGQSRKATFWQETPSTWGVLVARLSNSQTIPVTHEAFMRLSKSQQDDYKDIGGYVAGRLKDGRRKSGNVLSRDVITIDADNLRAGGTDELLQRLTGLGCGYAVHSTCKHSPASPRLRILIPTNLEMQPDEYEPIIRMLCRIIQPEMTWFDKTTAEPSRLMYWPTHCQDTAPVWVYEDKPLLAVDGMLALHHDWHNVSEWPRFPGEQETRAKLAAKQENPTTKNGLIGAFCRVYDVCAAMDKFLPGVYAPAELTPDRLTYTAGSTTGGAVLYDNGTFLYSNHATDPAGGKLCNAFDLVRLHLFADKDDIVKPDTPANKLPSYTAMCDLALKDTAVSALIDQERYEKVAKAFTVPFNECSDSWLSLLKKNESGAYDKSAENALTVLKHDPRFKEKLRLDNFAHRVMITGPLPWCPDDYPRQWTNNDRAMLFIELEKFLHIRAYPIDDTAFQAVSTENSFHPVRDYLVGLTWDNITRLDTLFIDYLCAEDTPYTRAVARKAFVAAVARVMTPGIKYDTMTILVGPQGLGKSTLLSIMGGEWFTDSLRNMSDKEAQENIQGKWLLEIAELDALNRSEITSAKNFISKQTDHFRAPYGHFSETHKRQCVFFGTTNVHDCLRDLTGGRRFWPVDVGLISPKKSVFNGLCSERDQLWAEAVYYWRLKEPLFLPPNLERVAKAVQEEHRDIDPWEESIRQFLDKPIPHDWASWTLTRRLIFLGGNEGDPREGLVRRERVCAREIWCELFTKPEAYFRQVDARRINAILASLHEWEKTSPIPIGEPYGVQRGYRRISTD